MSILLNKFLPSLIYPKFELTMNVFIYGSNSVIGTNFTQLRDKILRQIPDDPRKTKEIMTKLELAIDKKSF